VTTSYRENQVTLTVAYSFDISWHEVYTSENIKLSILMIPSLHFPYTYISAPRGLSFWSPVPTFPDIQSSLHYPLHPLPLRVTPWIQSIWHPEFTHYIEFTLFLTPKSHSPLHPFYSWHYMHFPLPLTSFFHATNYFIPRDSHFSLNMKTSFCFTWQLASILCDIQC